MFCVPIQLVRDSALLPVAQTCGSAGYDLHACISEDIVLKPMQRMLVPTGIAIAIPVGFEGQVRPRSGLAINHGISVINAPGTIDSDYRGEIKVGLINLSEDEFIIKHQMRIAQLIITSYQIVEWKIEHCLDKTNRDHLGFGSTGY
jgi:dUTP pyrophosphatase